MIEMDNVSFFAAGAGVDSEADALAEGDGASAETLADAGAEPDAAGEAVPQPVATDNSSTVATKNARAFFIVLSSNFIVYKTRFLLVFGLKNFT
jgi:hypothetical protein